MQVGNAGMARFGLVGVNIGSRSLSFPKKSSEGSGGALIDGCEENLMCYRRPLQQGKQAAESRPVAVNAGTFRRTGKEKMNLGSAPSTRCKRQHVRCLRDRV